MNEQVSSKFRCSYLISAILVMIMHCSGGIVGDGQGLLSKIAYLICKTGVPAVAWFIFMSAYFVYRGRAHLTNNEFKDLIVRKLRNLMLPYITWNTIGLIWYICIYNTLIGSNLFLPLNGKTLVKAYLPFQSANGGLWTMALLFILALFSPVIFKICKAKCSIICIVAIEIIIIIFSKTASSILYWVPVYMLGAYVGIHYWDVFEKIIGGNENHISGGVNLGSFFSVLLYIFAVVITNTIAQYFPRIAVEGILRFISPILFMQIMRYVKAPKYVNWYIKNGSFFIYVSHGMLIDVIGVIIRYLFLNKGLLVPYICVIIIISLMELSFLMLMKKLSTHKLAWIFTGGR